MLANHQDIQELAACTFLVAFQKHIYFSSKRKKNFNDNVAKTERRLDVFSAYSGNDFSICMQHVSCSATKPNC